jgi:hypothetical protein
VTDDDVGDFFHHVSEISTACARLTARSMEAQELAKMPRGLVIKQLPTRDIANT